MDESSSPTRNGLTTIFSKGRRDKKNRESASNSLKSASSTVGTATDSESHRGLRGSVDSTIDRLSHHDDDSGESNGIKKLIPKIGAKRRQKKQEQEDEQLAMEEAARGRSVAERGTLENENRTPMSRDDSTDNESQMVYEPEPDHPP